MCQLAFGVPGFVKHGGDWGNRIRKVAVLTSENLVTHWPLQQIVRKYR